MKIYLRLKSTNPNIAKTNYDNRFVYIKIDDCDKTLISKATKHTKTIAYDNDRFMITYEAYSGSGTITSDEGIKVAKHIRNMVQSGEWGNPHIIEASDDFSDVVIYRCSQFHINMSRCRDGVSVPCDFEILASGSRLDDDDPFFTSFASLDTIEKLGQDLNSPC